MRLVVICLKHETLCRTKAQALFVVAEAEAHIETCIKERAQLLRLTSETMEHPGHRWTKFTAQL